MKRKTRSCSISMRPMHVSVFVCVCAYKWATSAAVVDIFACAFYMGVFGYTLRRSTSASPSLALFALHFPFCCCFFSLIFNATEPGSIPCMWLYFNSLPRVRSSPSPFSVCLQLWHVACFTFALFLSFFFLHLVANFNCLETSCGPAEISISNSSAAVARTGPGRLLICPKPKLPCLSVGLAARLESSINY